MSRLFLAVVMVIGLVGMSGSHTLAASPPMKIGGTWSFTTTDSMYTHFTVHFTQHGPILRGNHIFGKVQGNTMQFSYIGVSSEDDFGAKGTIATDDRHISGSFWDGYGGQGTFTAVRAPK